MQQTHTPQCRNTHTYAYITQAFLHSAYKLSRYHPTPKCSPRAQTHKQMDNTAAPCPCSHVHPSSPDAYFKAAFILAMRLRAIPFYFLHSQKMTTDGSSPFCLLGSPPVNQLCFGGTQQQVCTPASCCWSILICHFISKAQGCKIGKDTKENRTL